MKRIFASAVALLLLLTALSGCADQQDPAASANPEITASSVTPERDALASCLTCKDGVYTLTLPQSGKTLELSATEARFVPYITDELVAEAENRVAQAAAAFVNHSGFYLQVNQDYLCLMIEAIRYLDSPNELGEDHEHLFYDGRISSQAVPEEEKTEIGTAKSAVRYRSGEEEIFAFCSLLWSEQDNGDGTFTATTVDRYDIVDLINGKTHISMEELGIPTLLLDGDVTARVPVNGEILRVRLLSEGEDGFAGSESSFEALSALDPGTYYVVVYVRISGNCDPDALQYSAEYEDVFRLEVGEPSHSGYETDVELLQYNWDGYGIGRKTLSCIDVGYRIIDALKNMKETGKVAEKLSDDVLEKTGDGLSGEFPVPPGTIWIEAEGKIYRLAPDLSQICRVETHFGEGVVLEMDDAFQADVRDAWQYAPFDYYKGTYHSGDVTVELKNVFASASSVELRIKEIRIEQTEDPHNRITVELLSSVDQPAAIKLHCEQSDDNMALGGGTIVDLRKGIAETVELTFGGWGDCRYWVYLMVDNTVAEITIEP